MKDSERMSVKLALLFILTYFFFFSYDSLSAYFTYDDATNMVHLHHVFEQSMWASLLQVLQVFTSANRPLGALFYRVFYALFGLNPLPFRIAIEILLCLNIGLSLLWTRTLGAGRETQVLAALLFCYNASMVDLYYNTGTNYDILCFSLYIGAMIVYIRGRAAGQMLTAPRTCTVLLLYLLALDAKEMAVTLPAALLLYELLYRFRDLKLRPHQVRNTLLLGSMLIAGAVFSRIKAADLTQDSGYQMHLSLPTALLGFAHYFEQLSYREQGSISAFSAFMILGAILSAAVLMRRREVIFGILFFIVSLLPVTVIPFRSGYAAYIAYPGLTLALAAILAEARFQLVRFLKLNKAHFATAVLLLFLVAAVHIRLMASYRLRAMGNMTWDQPKRSAFVTAFRQTIPEFPPGARVLIAKDSWGDDWGPAFITRLLYGDPTVWVERTPNLPHAPDLASYDLVVDYQEPNVDMSPARFFGVPMPWEIRASERGDAQLKVSSPNRKRGTPNLEFRPSAARSGRIVELSIPGFAGATLDAVCRIVTSRQSARRLVQNWCTVDRNGIATVTAPQVDGSGVMVVDWIRPAGEHWIFTSAVLVIGK